MTMTSTEAKVALLEQKLNEQTAFARRAINEYEIYRNCADNGQGGDITRGGVPLLTFAEWLED